MARTQSSEYYYANRARHAAAAQRKARAQMLKDKPFAFVEYIAQPDGTDAPFGQNLETNRFATYAEGHAAAQKICSGQEYDAELQTWSRPGVISMVIDTRHA